MKSLRRSLPLSLTCALGLWLARACAAGGRQWWESALAVAVVFGLLELITEVLKARLGRESREDKETPSPKGRDNDVVIFALFFTVLWVLLVLFIVFSGGDIPT